MDWTQIIVSAIGAGAIILGPGGYVVHQLNKKMDRVEKNMYDSNRKNDSVIKIASAIDATVNNRDSTLRQDMDKQTAVLNQQTDLLDKMGAILVRVEEDLSEVRDNVKTLARNDCSQSEQIGKLAEGLYTISQITVAEHPEYYKAKKGTWKDFFNGRSEH